MGGGEGVGGSLTKVSTTSRPVCVKLSVSVDRPFIAEVKKK